MLQLFVNLICIKHWQQPLICPRTILQLLVIFNSGFDTCNISNLTTGQINIWYSVVDITWYDRIPFIL